MRNWLPQIVKEELAVNRDGDMICDGRGWPLLRGASNYFSIFYGIAWFGWAFPLYQGPVLNAMNGKKVW